MKTVNSKGPNAIENLNLYGSLLNVLPSKHDSKNFMTNQNNFGESLRSINHNQRKEDLEKLHQLCSERSMSAYLMPGQANKESQQHQLERQRLPLRINSGLSNRGLSNRSLFSLNNTQSPEITHPQAQLR